jgi:hypothetical protein
MNAEQRATFRMAEAVVGELCDALDKHGKSLSAASKEASKFSRGLMWATWALVFATFVLAGVTGVTLALPR